MKKRSGFTMHTDAMYRDIKEIEYEPTEERNVSLAFKAGKWRFWKFLVNFYKKKDKKICLF